MDFQAIEKKIILSLKGYKRKLQFEIWYDEWKGFTKSLYLSYICQRFETFSDKGFTIVDNLKRGGTYWTVFYVRTNKPFYFDSFDGQLDKFLFTQLPKPIIYIYYKEQDMNSRLCGSYWLYFLYLIKNNDLVWYYFKNLFWLTNVS